MSNRALIVALVVASSLLAVGNHAGIAGSLFWKLPWFDMPMHLCGGIVVSLALLSAFRSVFGRRGIFPELVISVAGAFTVGIAWEAWEVLQQLMFMEHPEYWSDTLRDILFDTLGGFLVWCAVRYAESRNS